MNSHVTIAATSNYSLISVTPLLDLRNEPENYGKQMPLKDAKGEKQGERAPQTGARKREITREVAKERKRRL